MTLKRILAVLALFSIVVLSHAQVTGGGGITSHTKPSGSGGSTVVTGMPPYVAFYPSNGTWTGQNTFDDLTTFNTNIIVGGGALLNDTVGVTNITASSCVVFYRTAGGGASGATINFNGIAIGAK